MKMTEKEFLMNLLSIPSVNGENSEKDIAVYIQQFMVGLMHKYNSLMKNTQM